MQKQEYFLIQFLHSVSFIAFMLVFLRRHLSGFSAQARHTYTEPQNHRATKCLGDLLRYSSFSKKWFKSPSWPFTGLTWQAELSILRGAHELRVEREDPLPRLLPMLCQSRGLLAFPEKFLSSKLVPSLS